MIMSLADFRLGICCFISLFLLLLLALLWSCPPCAMGFYPNDIFEWHYTLLVFFAGSFFGSSVATL